MKLNFLVVVILLQIIFHCESEISGVVTVIYIYSYTCPCVICMHNAIWLTCVSHSSLSVEYKGVMGSKTLNEI